MLSFVLLLYVTGHVGVFGDGCCCGRFQYVVAHSVVVFHVQTRLPVFCVIMLKGVCYIYIYIYPVPFSEVVLERGVCDVQHSFARKRYTYSRGAPSYSVVVAV